MLLGKIGSNFLSYFICAHYMTFNLLIWHTFFLYNKNEVMASKRKREKKGKTDSSQHYIFSDEVTKNKIKRHLKDIKDVITDEDIARAKIPGEETQPANS